MLPAVAVQRTIVSPERTTTAPPAWRANLPVSKEISSPPTSTETRLTSNKLIYVFPFGRPVGGQSCSELSFSNGDDLTDAAGNAPRGSAQRAQRFRDVPADSLPG